MSAPATGPVTGWEPHLPAGDTLVRQAVLAIADSHAGPVAAAGGTVVTTDDYTLADLGHPSVFQDTVTLRRPPAPDVGEVLDEIGSLLAGGRGRVWLWSAWPTPDLGEHGWVLSGHPPLLWRPPGPVAAGDAGDLDIVAATDAATLADAERVAVEGFPIDDARSLRPGTVLPTGVLDDPRASVWVGYVDGRAIAVGESYRAGVGLDVFSLGVTLPSHRGRGYWRALAHRRLQDGGGRPTVGLFSDLSRGPAEGIGFVPVLRFTAWFLERP